LNILVDTSVWSLSLRRQSKDNLPEIQQLQSLILAGETVHITGIILQEILQGLRNDQHFKKLKRYLESFSLILPTRETHVNAATIYTKCRSSGIQTSTVDCLIASIAINHDCYLFTTDKDFTYIANLVPLQLLN
jgi:predicted nucleic acid-binding protein